MQSAVTLGAISSSPIRVMLVDSQQIVLLGLERLIESEGPAMKVVGTADNFTEARRQVAQTRPDILLLDLQLGGGKGAEFVPAFIRDGRTRVVIFAAERDLDAIDRAVFNGARGLVRKEDSLAILLTAIRKVHDGELWLDHKTTGRIFVQFARAGGALPSDPKAEEIKVLTHKEIAIVNAFADKPGFPNKKIAESLCMSEHTLRNHLTSIFDKLDISGRFELFEFAKAHRDCLSNSFLRPRRHSPSPD